MENILQNSNQTIDKRSIGQQYKMKWKKGSEMIFLKAGLKK